MVVTRVILIYYRPISVISSVMKILERLIHDQLFSFLQVNNILAQEQSGFTPRHSTHTALLDVTDFLLEQIDNGNYTVAVFLDLKKAFDTVNHTILLQNFKALVSAVWSWTGSVLTYQKENKLPKLVTNFQIFLKPLILECPNVQF